MQERPAFLVPIPDRILTPVLHSSRLLPGQAHYVQRSQRKKIEHGPLRQLRSPINTARMLFQNWSQNQGTAGTW